MTQEAFDAFPLDWRSRSRAPMRLLFLVFLVVVLAALVLALRAGGGVAPGTPLPPRVQAPIPVKSPSSLHDQIVNNSDVGRSSPDPVSVLAPRHGTASQVEGTIAVTLSSNVVTDLVPGTSAPIDLVITNPQPLPVTLSQIGVTLDSLAAPNASVAFPCSLADYSVTSAAQLTVTIPGGSTTSLSRLGVPEAQWPTVTMLNTAHNQYGCSDAAVTLAYSATGGAQ